MSNNNFTYENKGDRIVCIDCGKTFFFSEKDKKFYTDMGFISPKRCYSCRKKRTSKAIDNNVNINVEDINYKKVHDEILEWSIEAKKEKKEYFYNVKEVEMIKKGKKSFVIGRKGSGKTSIAQYLCSAECYNEFAEKLTFKNFPFNILYELENKHTYTAPNQYISMWKYVIYNNICKAMACNHNIDVTVRDKLTQLYGDSASMSLDKLVKKWTSKAFGIEVLGVGFNVEGVYSKDDISWLDILEILENVIREYCDDSYYYIIFDELDEDYKNFKSESEADNYKSMLTSLFKSIFDIRAEFINKNIFPVAFLRSDIYDQITDSDKNKWNESAITLKWDSDTIKAMLAHRLCVAFNVEIKSFEEAWNMLFNKENVSMGNQQKKQLHIYDYIERSTEMRPRDFIQYIKECVLIADKKSEKKISVKTVKDADESFSVYLKQETLDELTPLLPEANEILGLLSTIRKQTFRFDTFEKEYSELVNQGNIPKRDVKLVLLMLFDAGVIGNQPSMRGQAIFKFSKVISPRFNFRETMLIHRGLYKALQIF